MTQVTPKPLRIIFDASPLLTNKTGVAYYTEGLVTQLAKQYPKELELVGFYYNFLGKHKPVPTSDLPNLRYHAVRFTPSKLIYQLRRWGIEFPVEYLAGTSADFSLFPNFLSYPSLRGTPSAPVIHDLTYLDLPQYVSPKNQRDLQRFVPKAIARSSFIIAVSEFTKGGVVDRYGVPAGSILVTHNPPLPVTQLPAHQAEELCTTAGVHKPFILYVGTIDPRKNVIGLIDGYLALPQKLRDQYSLVLVGRVESFAKAEARKIAAVQAAGHNVIHPGYVSDELKQALWQRATMFAHAANYEGFGMPVLEAMARGLPAAISDIPIFHEIAGNAPLFFDHTKPKSIATAIETILTNPRKAKQLAEAGRQQAALFTWQRAAAKVWQQIQHVLSAQP